MRPKDAVPPPYSLDPTSGLQRDHLAGFGRWSHSGPIAIENVIPDLLPVLLAETGILGYQPWNGTVSLLMYSVSAAFSPDVDDWPYYVDLPVDYYGNVIDEVWDLWLGHDALTLAQ